MTRSASAPLLGALLGILLASSAASARELDKARIAEVERLLSSFMTKHGIPGLSAAIALDGKVIWSNGYGLADVENFVPAKAATVYRSASIGKSLTATAAMTLVEKGRLDLDAPVQRYCPAFPIKQWPVTTRHLLSHLGGIRHYGGPHDLEEQFSTRHYQGVVEALEPFKNDPLLFEPGTEFRYSTYGYGVVGCVVEGASGRPFLEYMRQAVFAPAAMKRTRDDDPAALIENRAAGYIRVDGQLRNAPHVDMSNRLPAGGYATTAEDLASFAAAYLDCKLVSCASVEAMMKEAKLENGDTVDYGMGWAIAEGPEKAASHGGSSPGVSGMLYVVPRKRFGLAFLTNFELAPERSELAAAIAKVLLRAPAAPGPAPSKP